MPLKVNFWNLGFNLETPVNGREEEATKILFESELGIIKSCGYGTCCDPTILFPSCSWYGP